jgi:ubiquinone/menaquinone biosynthesis C-methylase UbiE
MHLTNFIKTYLKPGIRKKEPEEAYDIWSSSYDKQPDNLMLYLDQLLFTHFLHSVSLHHKIVLDFGCGTGRHWKSMYEHQPAQMIGIDVSEGMLEQLKQKYPSATVIHNKDNQLLSLQDNFVDILVSTLTIAHVKNIHELFVAWNRLVKPGGEIYISDYHPMLLQNGGQRDFRMNGKKYSITNYVHPLNKIKGMARNYGWTLIQEEQKLIDKEVKSFYEKQGALSVYNRFEGFPVIYGVRFKKQ